MKKPYLPVGKIVSTSGLKGEVRVMPWSDTPNFLLQFATLYFDEGKTPVVVQDGRVQKNIAILKFAEINDVDAANRLRGRVLWCAKNDVTLEDGRWFIEDLLGMTVVDADDETKVYGTITEVSPTGANDVYHVEKDGATVLIPALKQVILSVDVAGGIMKIRPMKGLFSDED